MPQELVALARDRNMAGADPRVDDRAKHWVKTRQGEFRQARVYLERDWVRCIRAWKMLMVMQSYNGRSKLVLPHVRNMVERLVQRIVANLCGKEDFFGVLPTKADDEDRAEVVKSVLKAQMEEEGYRRETALVIRDAIIMGTGFKKLRWQYDVEMMNVPVYQGDEWVVGPAGPEMKPVYSQNLMPRVLHNRPKADRLDPFNLFVDLSAPDFDSTDTVETGKLTATEIIKQVEQGVFNQEAVMRALQNRGSNPSPSAGLGYKEVRDIALGIRMNTASKQTDFWEYNEFWGLFPLEAANDEEARRTPMEKVLIGILGDEVVRLERNPLLSQSKPYLRGVIIDVPGQFYGDSPVKAAIPVWQEINDCRNQANDARSFAVNPVMLRGPGNEDKKTSQRVFPGAIITGANLQFAAFPDTTGAAYAAEAMMTRDLEETTGAPRTLDGQISSDSATEATIQREESVARISGYVKTLEDSMVVPELRLRLDYNRQFLRTSDAVRIRGASGFDWRPYTPEDFMPQYDFICMGAVMMQTRAMLTAGFAATTDRMLAFEQLSPGLFDWVRWWGTFFRDGLGIEHASLYIKPMKRQERTPTIEEVIVMLSDGQRPEPDPRQNFEQTLPVLASFLATHAPQMPPDLQKSFRDYFRKALDTAKAMVAEQQIQQMQLMLAMSGGKMQQGGGGEQAGPSGPGGAGKGGARNQQVGPEQRDGRGISTGRQAMMGARGAVQP